MTDQLSESKPQRRRRVKGLVYRLPGLYPGKGPKRPIQIGFGDNLISHDQLDRETGELARLYLKSCKRPRP